MDWSTDKIIETVKDIRKDSNILTEQAVKTKYSVFIEKFPKLYYTCTTPNFDFKTFYTMITYRNKAESENIPNLVRDVTIGETMAKKYLYPIVGEPTVEQKKNAAAKVAEKYYNKK